MPSTDHRPVTSAATAGEIARLGTEEAARQQTLLRVRSQAVADTTAAEATVADRRRGDRRGATR